MIAFRRFGPTVCVVALLAAGVPALAQSKQDRYGEMISIAQEMETIKGNPAERDRFQQLDDRYRELSASLGGDDPAKALSAPAVPPPHGPQGVGVTPPGCPSSANAFPSTDTPVAIPDGPGGMVASTITVSGLATYLQDVDVTTDITHTFASDLEVTLTSPAGTVVTLTTDNGGGNDDVFSGTRWDDDGGDTNPPGPATDNTYANLTTETPLVPEEAFAAFIGEDPNGDWTLDITDGADLDTGDLNSWSLSLITLDSAPFEDSTVSTGSSDTPIAIPDGPGGTADSTITVSGAGAFVCDVDVTTDITHTFAADLEITLTSPGGTVSTMTTDNGGGNDDVFSGTLWDDDGGDTNPPGPATDNTYANLVTETPLVFEEALGAFVGEDPNGDWTLDITDDASDDTGTLNSWSVDVSTCSCTADLEVVKTGAVNGSLVTWTVEVTNNGPIDATGVVITDTLDSCTVYLSDDCGGSNLPPWTWNVGALANGATATCNIVVDAGNCTGTLANSATATGDQNDPDSTNDTGSTAVEILSVLEIPTLGGIALALLLAVLASSAVILLAKRS